MSGDVRPIRVGDSLRDETDDEVPVAVPQGKSLCENCFHQGLCVVAVSVRATGSRIAVGACEHHLPVTI